MAFTVLAAPQAKATTDANSSDSTPRRLMYLVFESRFPIPDSIGPAAMRNARDAEYFTPAQARIRPAVAPPQAPFRRSRCFQSGRSQKDAAAWHTAPKGQG